MAAPEGISAFRAYSKPFDTNKGTQSFTQIYDSGYIWENGSNVTQTGAWRPLFASDFVTSNNISVSGLTITGVSIDTTALQQVTASGVAFQAAVSGQTATLVSEATNRWKKVASSGFVQTFSPLVGSSLVSKVQGLSKTSVNPSYIQIYDGSTGAGNYPVATINVQNQNNWFYEFSEAGVQFNNGITIINSSDAISPIQYGNADFFASVIYK